MKRPVGTASRVLMTLAVLGVIACGGDEAERSASASPAGGAAAPAGPVTVEVEKAVFERFTEYGEYYGVIEPVEEVRLSAAAGGRVERIGVEPGDRVSAGTSLARIDAARAETRYQSAVVGERVARRRYEMQKTLHARGNTSDNRLDEAHLAWLQSTSVLLDARRAREGALAVTPIDGIVVAKRIDLHDELAPGSSTFTVADLTRMRVTVGVPEGDIAGVQELTSAELRVASAPGRVWEGRPVSFARQRSASTLSFAVEILVDNPEGALLSGATAHVRLALRSHENRIVVPSSALVSEGNESYVFVVNSPTVRRLPVKLGPSDDTRTVLLEGVSSGDEVIVTGMNQVREGDRVRVRRRKETGTAAGKHLAEQSEGAILPEAGR